MEFISTLFAWFTEHGADLWIGLSSIVTGASLLATVTPWDWDNRAMAWLRQVLDWLSMNWGHAKDAPK